MFAKEQGAKQRANRGWALAARRRGDLFVDRGARTQGLGVVLRVVAAPYVVTKRQLAPVTLELAREHLEQCRLAGAILADDRDALAAQRGE